MDESLIDYLYNTFDNPKLSIVTGKKYLTTVRVEINPDDKEASIYQLTGPDLATVMLAIKRDIKELS